MKLGFVALLVWLGSWAAPAGVLGARVTKVLHYDGYSLTVPSAWPVYRLRSDPTACVRFDRHAVYLGQPSADQRCPAHAAGRTEAILVEPLLSHPSRAGGAGGQVLPMPSTAGAAPVHGSSAQLINAARGVVLTATWSHHPAVIQRALGVGSLATVAEPSKQRSLSAVPAAVGQSRSAARAGVTSAPSPPGGAYMGLGFDSCSTPSSSEMSAWGLSPYRAIGVYIGGANMACSQTNLTSNWVSQQSAAGWHLVPIYVGLQAQSNSCGCASISSASPTSQGTAAARDAVAQAQAIGLGRGNPLYFDMEAYTRGSGDSPVVLRFLAAWTAQLHASGYQSGVYSSADSGIQDLVAQTGTGYQEPDDVWIADWNGAKSTSDPNVPRGDWPAHQRLHQYQGGHNEIYRGVTINIDGDYLDGATAAAGSGVSPAVASSLTLSVSPAADGTIDLYPRWGGATGVSAWQVIAGATPSLLTPAAKPTSASARMPIVIRSAFRYFAVRALGSDGQTLSSSAPVATPAHVAIFGQSAFVPLHGMAGLAVGCFSATPCHLTTTIIAGPSTLARTGPERIAPGGGLAYFNLASAGRAMLARTSHHRLAVKITVRDASGASATRQLLLIPFATSGPGRHRSVKQSPTLRIIGTTEFVSHGQRGGILIACLASTPCHASTTITAAGKIIAHTGPEVLGVNELGYLAFSLTAAGQRILTHTHGNQLPAKVTITSASTTATAQIALASFS